jgi:hypothetical protein
MMIHTKNEVLLWVLTLCSFLSRRTLTYYLFQRADTTALGGTIHILKKAGSLGSGNPDVVSVPMCHPSAIMHNAYALSSENVMVVELRQA